MANNYYDHQAMTKKEMDRQVRERADRIQSVSQQEAESGITVSDETNLQFFKEG